MSASDSNRLITNKLRLLGAEQILNYTYSPNNPNTGLYIFAGHSDGYSNGTPVPDNSLDTAINAYENMLFGKQVTNLNIAPVISRYDWVSGTVYSFYNDSDPNLYTEQFYVGVNTGSSYDIFKCISNNNGSPSTVPPNLADTSASDNFYQTSDGYQWKYMYSITPSQLSNFATSLFVPVFPNANVSGNASSGSIDFISVSNSGSFYNNYYSGQFNLSDIQVSGNPLYYNLSGPTASSNSNFYANSIIVITSGTGIGQFKTIANYNIVGNNKIAVVNSAFTVIPDATSVFEISPLVSIYGDGYQTINAVARAIINSSSSNCVSSVQILTPGANYTVATANVLSSNTIPSSGAILDVIIPPIGGHGFDAYNELGATGVCVQQAFNNSESNTITINNSYSQIGILKDPMFSNVSINTLNSSNTAGANGTFIVGETIYQINPVFLSGTVNINASSNVITGTSNFSAAFTSNSFVYITSGVNSFIEPVGSVVNSSYMTLQSNGSFSSNNASIAMVTISAEAIVSSFSTSNLNVGSLFGLISDGALLVGNSSGTTAYVNNYSITGVAKPFTTFNQLVTVSGTVVGSFNAGEAFLQVSSNTTGFVHSYVSPYLYITDVVGKLNANNDTIVGQTTGSVITISEIISGDLVKNSGEILYYEDLAQPISRANNQSENIKIILQF